jgi:hypothetical protein
MGYFIPGYYPIRRGGVVRARCRDRRRPDLPRGCTRRALSQRQIFARGEAIEPAVELTLCRRFATHVFARSAMRVVLFRDCDRNPDVLDPADGAMEQETEKQEGRAVPWRIIYRVIVTVVINGWERPIWWTIGYINL